jgi:hypothetical protein
LEGHSGRQDFVQTMTAPMSVLQIVPTLPPPVEGVGAFALTLASALEQIEGLKTRFVVGDPRWVPGGGAGHLCEALPSRSSAALAEALGVRGGGEEGGRSAAVLAHYVNYGFQRRGCPFWLVRGLERWRGQDPSRRLVTVFHEVYAYGPPWRSSFWLFPFQRFLARRLLAASDGAVTSLERYVGRLGRRAPNGGVEVLPVFSTVGELPNPLSVADRQRTLIVFGGRGVRERAYGPFLHGLEQACMKLGIEVVHDVGPPTAATPARVAGRPVERHGALAADAVSTLLRDALAGFLAYPPAFLPKSTIYAAYVAHGVLPACAWSGRSSQARGPQDLKYWDPGGSTITEPLGALQAIAAAAHRWYQGHSVGRHAAILARMLRASMTAGAVGAPLEETGGH